MQIGGVIYLDFQATTPVDPRVIETMIPFLNEKFGNPHSSEHSMGWEAAKAIEEAAVSVSNLICADPDEIVFTSGATESNNLALFGLCNYIGRKRNRILISSIEHKSIMAVARELEKRYGVEIIYIPVNREGFVDLNFIADNIDETVLAVSVMAVNNEIGSIQPLKSIGELTREHGVIFHCDAAQGPCSINLDVYDINVDMMSLSAHKVYGPKGVGAIYIGRETVKRIAPLLYGGGQQNHMRAGTVPVPLCVALGKACDLLMDPNHVDERISVAAMRDVLVENLTHLGWPIYLNGPQPSKRHPGNANLRFEGFSAQDILAALQPRLCASSGSACTSGIPEPSYVLQAIGLSYDEAISSIRFSLGRFTKVQDINESVILIEEVLSRLKISNSI